MTRSFFIWLSTAWVGALISSPLAAQDDFWTVLQEQPFEFTSAQLVANDSFLTQREPPVTIESFPANGTLTQLRGRFVYQPRPFFFGVDTFRYSWLSQFGPIEGVVELFVTPWLTPLAGSMGLLDSDSTPDREDIGYYNSHSGTFYFCQAPETSSAPQNVTCTPYRYPQFKPGWLPLMGTWRDSAGRVLPNRPGLYDPVERRVHLLDESFPRDCPTCSAPIPALPLREIQRVEFLHQNPSAVIPVAMDPDGDGIDTVVFFRPSDRRFEVTGGLGSLVTTLDDATLWPLTVPDEHGAIELAVFGQESGRLDVLSQGILAGLWSGTSSLATARRVGDSVAYEVYDVFSHSLSTSEPVWITINGECEVFGTQLLRFPSDPDPPPSGGGTRNHAAPCVVP